ncbi:MAG: UDP-N-acetylmuramoyl-L-alanine--D-glutamate ligase [Verrucomicrobiota bacterium JB023]|nr:UDP-N-acetylmuramoyl-L-alanine--D-glutamate ligase [Verrucomicrobiota bacterium JB023]
MAILGAGRSGRAAAELCLRLGAKVTVYDTGTIVGDWPEAITLTPNATPEMGKETRADLVVVSPGIETAGDFAQAFAEGSGGFIGELELGFLNYRGLVVAITGTNGKTTTTELVSAFLNESGISCLPCGNHGRPLCDVVLDDEPPESIALEVSSFQLETIETFRPDIAIWLNFAPDHMDRYATIEEYRAAKMRIFENMTEDQAIIARSEEDLESIKSKVIRFMSEWDDEADAEYLFKDGLIYRAGVPFVSLEDTTLRGLHNAENIMAATAAAHEAGADLEKIKESLKSFVPPPHRCELIRTLDGVEYLNDSKATNLHALEAALRSQLRPVVLIAGGKDKGLDYQPLTGILGEKAVASVTFGQIGQSLAKVFSSVVETRPVETLEEAVLAARELAPPGSTVLFSPGTSSFDQFSSYVERGDAFREIVKQLK